jgi:hypothetical protein
MNLPPHGQLYPLLSLVESEYVIGNPAASTEQLRKANDLCSQITPMDILVPQVSVAETCVEIGLEAEALSAYEQATDRAETLLPRSKYMALTEICISMAQHHVEPDEELRNRIREIQANLGDPW